MKKYFTIALLTWLLAGGIIPAMGQRTSTNFGQIVTPEGQTPRAFKEYLVQLAWYNSPGNLVFRRQVDIAADEVKLTHWEWLKDAGISFNLNEANLRKTPDSLDINQNLFFPRYNIGLTFNLGSIVSRPAQTRIAKQQLKIIELEEQQQMLEIRAEVLRRYEAYEMAVEVLRSRTLANRDAETVYNLVTEQFENGKVDFSDYSSASLNYHNSTERVVTAQSDLNRAIINLEEMIGISWEKALKRKK